MFYPIIYNGFNQGGAGFCNNRITMSSQLFPAPCSGWWFQTCFIFHFIYGMSSFPLTNSSFFKMVTSHHQVTTKQFPVVSSSWPLQVFDLPGALDFLRSVGFQEVENGEALEPWHFFEAKMVTYPGKIMSTTGIYDDL
jgi:hypothetical protein